MSKASGPRDVPHMAALPCRLRDELRDWLHGPVSDPDGKAAALPVPAAHARLHLCLTPSECRYINQAESGFVPCDQCESGTFVHSQVVRLIALDLDQILWLLLRSMHRIVLELNLGGVLFLNRPSNSACL